MKFNCQYIKCYEWWNELRYHILLRGICFSFHTCSACSCLFGYIFPQRMGVKQRQCFHIRQCFRKRKCFHIRKCFHLRQCCHIRQCFHIIDREPNLLISTSIKSKKKIIFLKYAMMKINVDAKRQEKILRRTFVSL